jgi:signal transduction histidine kinase/ligand-binding sensor domain-containing protein/DNA-binding response OmpR family regulator
MRILLNLLLVFTVFGLTGQNISFNTISTKDGLSSNYTTAVLEDSRGFIWITTKEGLNRWDGYNFNVYKNDPKDPHSLPGNFTLCLAEDKHDNIWIGTNQDGLSRYNISEEKFYNYNLIPGDSSSLPGTVIRCIFIDKNDNIWIGTNDGLAKYIPSKNEFKLYLFSINGQKHRTHIRKIFRLNDQELLIQNNSGLFKMNLSNEIITEFKNNVSTETNPILKSFPILLDSEGLFWIGSLDGLIKYNTKTQQTVSYIHTNDNEKSISSHNFAVIFEDSHKNVWFGTDNNGVSLYNKETDDFTRFKTDIKNTNSIANNIITNIYEDKNGILWFTTQEGGVSFINPNMKKFEHFVHNPFDENSISHNKVSAFCEDKNGTIWIGTGNGGINKLNNDNSIDRIHLKNNFLSPSILAIIENPSKENSLYITGWGAGLYELNTKNNKLKNLFPIDNGSNHVPIINIKGMGIDSDKNVWLATHHRHGIEVYNPETNTFYNKYNPGSFKSNILGSTYAVSMKEDSKKRIWIITYTGLYMFDSTYRYFHSYNEDSNTICSNYVYTLHEDSKGRIWVGSSKGLDKIIETDTSIYFERLTHKYNLPLNIKGILEDDNGILWLSSSHGISTFDPSTKKVKTVFKAEELGNHEFFERSVLKSQKGEMYFGSTNGFVKFHPDTILNAKLNPKLYLIDFQIFNKSQKVDANNSPLTKSVLETQEIELSYKQSDLSFEYVALNYNRYQNLDYAYTLEGFDPEWYFVGNKRFARYTNLPHGTYTFKARIVDGDQISEVGGINIKIKINPPFWKTKLAQVLYVLLIILTLYLFRYAIIMREKLKNELKMEKIALKNVHEANLMKLRFFTNISHEFKTPLTLIKAPIDKIISDESEHHSDEHKSQLRLIKRNADRLLKMVNQLMDYRKLEAGSLMLETSQGDIVEFSKNIWEIFNELATQRKIKYEFKSLLKKEIMSFDSDKLDKIISNLIANSIKHTGEYGSIVLSIKKLRATNSESSKTDNDEIEISVKDDGTGIPKKDLPYIFDRFYSASKKSDSKIEGTGIGLTLVKELTELHGGRISVSSKVGEGAEFKVILPIIKQTALEKNTQQEKISDEETKYDVIEQQIKNKIESKQKTENKFKVLVVEDDPDLRAFIRNELVQDYEVLTAKDGEDGQRKTFFNFPDIIISDVMMPNMDGFELCKSIKSDERTSHIPVILLTARHSEEKNIEGFEAGADDYFYKPFNLTLLKSRINNLLVHRWNLIEKFKKDANFEFSNEGIDTKDKELIQSIINIVLENINEEKINAEFISNRIHISRSLLYIKVEAITGQSVNEFIRGIRLKKALKLLKQNSMSIAYAVGFSSQPYFTRCFTKLYGESPTEFINKTLNN